MAAGYTAGAAVLEGGGVYDWHFGSRGQSFKPVKVSRVYKDGDVIELGDTRFKVVETPGYSNGHHEGPRERQGL